MSFLINLYNFLGKTSGTVIFLFILGLFLYALILTYLSWKNAKQNIFKFKSIFKRYKTISRANLNEIYIEFKKINKEETWIKFENNLVSQKDKTGEERFYTIYPIKDFFDLNLFGGDLISNKFITIAPALLTGLGLFGTFLGLSIGLHGVNTDPEYIGSSINKIISGASTAFSTSLIGIGASLIINFLDKLAITQIRKSLNRLRNILYDLFPQIKLEESFIHIEEYNANMNEVMETLAEKIGNKMQEGMLEATSQMNESISKALDQLVIATQSWGERVTSGSEGVLSSLITEFIEKVGANANNQRVLLEESSNKMSNVVASLDNMMTKYNTMTNDSFENIQKQQEEANKKHIENLDTYNSKLIEVSEDVFNKQEKHTQIIDNLLEKCSNVSSGLSEELSNLKDNLGDVNDNISEIVNKFDETVDKFDSSSSKLEQAGDIFQEAGQKLVEPMENTIQSFEQISSKNLETQDKMKEISDNLSDILSECEDAIDSVKTLLDNSNNTFNTLSRTQNDFLKEQKDNLNSLSERLKENFESYTESLTQQTNNRLGQWNEKTQQFSSAMCTTVQAIQSVVDNIETKIK